jgi:hypothetical protein
MGWFKTGQAAMEWRKAARVAFAFLVLAIALLLIPGVIMALEKLAYALPAFWKAALLLLLFVGKIALFVLLFFAVPEFLLLLRLDAMSLWTRVFVGGLSGILFALAVYLSTAFGPIFLLQKSSGEIFLNYVHLFSNPLAFAEDFYTAAGPGQLIAAILIGMGLGGLAWARIYRLPDDTKRDWDGPILGGRPPYTH